ncbi:hypothetical protein [Sporolactobacillus nakayamae]|uniref:ABC-2 type transport system permease protein n=1 Tax=Sporolactobacillus nakayamae TaxID=269670 RepID=A0A1I2RB98_9BACL|nr:hypothetical protein [Sporolactobacillus nakayamae]SFG37740.1 hypothetical protein SAMN02982927_01523 [Sporolactobacillus nakayamae]
MLIIKCIPLIKHFLRVMFYYKINFIFTFGVPLFSISYTMRSKIFQQPQPLPTMEMILFWTGYMIVLYALLGSGPAIVMLREDQFLKQFVFISGNRWTVIAAKYSSQLIVLLVSTWVLDIVCSVFFSLPFITLLWITLAMIFICELPIYALFLFFVALNVRQETIQPIMNILIFFFIALTWNDFSGIATVDHIITIINPIDYASQVGRALLSRIFPNVIFSPPSVMVLATCIYLMIGLFSIKRMKILPIFRN